MKHELPLRRTTPPYWANRALAEPLRLLNDHAHLEKRAGTNALGLLHRWPETDPPEHWVQAITRLAQDEVEHLAVVCRLLARRGGQLTKSHRNPYARALRDLVRIGRGADELVDRLMVGALIEVRSCERFALLADACADAELAQLYRDLTVADYGHYRVYLDLARNIRVARGIEARWSELLDAEAAIIVRQEPGARIHSWEESAGERR